MELKLKKVESEIESLAFILSGNTYPYDRKNIEAIRDNYIEIRDRLNKEAGRPLSGTIAYSNCNIPDVSNNEAGMNERGEYKPQHLIIDECIHSFGKHSEVAVCDSCGTVADVGHTLFICEECGLKPEIVITN